VSVTAHTRRTKVCSCSIEEECFTECFSRHRNTSSELATNFSHKGNYTTCSHHNKLTFL